MLAITSAVVSEATGVRWVISPYRAPITEPRGAFGLALLLALQEQSKAMHLMRISNEALWVQALPTLRATTRA